MINRRTIKFNFEITLLPFYFFKFESLQRQERFILKRWKEIHSRGDGLSDRIDKRNYAWNRNSNGMFAKKTKIIVQDTQVTSHYNQEIYNLHL
jgi:hypothetical protein